MADPKLSPFLQQFYAGDSNPAAETNAAQTEKDRAIWNSAATATDPKQAVSALDNLAKNSTNSVVSDIAYEKKKELSTQLNEYERVKQGVYSAGNVGTPESNIAAANAINKYSHKPQIGQALIASMLGQDAIAYKLITGGEQKTQIKWGKSGDMYYQTVDGFGNPVKTLDAQGNQLSAQDLQDRGVSYDSFDNTIAGVTSKEMYKARAEAANTDQKGNAQFYSTFVPQEAFIADALGGLQDLKNVPADSLREALSIASKNITSAYSGSTNVQKGKTASASTGTTDEKTAGAKGGVTLGTRPDTGEVGTGAAANLATGASTKNATNLSGGTTNLNISGTSRQNEESSLQKTRELLIAARLKGLDAQQIDKLLNAHQLINKLAQDQASLGEYKKPGFVARLAPQEVGDNLSLLKAELLKAQYNVTQLKQYQPFYNKAIEGYKNTGMAPAIGEIESNFISDPFHKSINQTYAKAIGSVLRDKSVNEQAPEASPPPTTAAKAPPIQDATGGRPPPQAAAPQAPKAATPQIPAGWTLKKDAKGNKAYVSPDGKQFIEVK
jgi:hypothetical protein